MPVLPFPSPPDPTLRRFLTSDSAWRCYHIRLLKAGWKASISEPGRTIAEQSGLSIEQARATSAMYRLAAETDLREGWAEPPPGLSISIHVERG